MEEERESTKSRVSVEANRIEGAIGRGWGEPKHR